MCLAAQDFELDDTILCFPLLYARYKVEPSGGMRDVAEKPNLLHSVEEHLLVG